jgi:hypothetical protein
MIAFAALWAYALPVARAQTVAYDAPLQPGNQAWTGNLGLDFNVATPILVSALGVLDANGDGFSAGATITVAIFNRSTQAVVAGPLSFTHANPGTLVAGDRFQSLSPAVTLPVGTYSVVAVGFGSLDLNGNSTIVGYTASTKNSGGGLIAFVGSGRYDSNTTLDFPSIVPSPNPTNVFLAGTFKFSAAPPAGSDAFLPGTDVSAGMFPEAIVVDKLNTPHASLAVANWGSGNVSVMKGTGNGSFAAATNYPAGAFPRAIAVGDLCGHGRRDLAIANWGAGTVSILCNNGSGGFPSVPSSFAAGPSPYGVAVGDFNGDNKPDLIVANDNIGATLLLGNGDGTFQPPIYIFDPALAPSSITVADFNNDGKLDFAAANPTLGTVSVLLGNGNGTFKPAVSTPLASSSRPLFITSGKLNESSGNPDVAVTDTLGTVWVLTGAGNGQFTKNGPYPVATYPNSIALGDLNGDGHQDLVVADMYGNVVSVLLGNGDGTVQPQVSFSSPSMALPVSVALGVFDESSTRLDAAVASFYGPINILLGEKVTIGIYSGNAQFAPLNTAFAHPAVVAAVAPSVIPAPIGIPVEFAIVAGAGGASATFAGGATTVTILTDTSGHATSPAFTANGIAGPFSIIATVGYGNPSVAGATVTFTEIN